MKALAVVVLRVVQLGIGGGYQHLVSSQSVRYALHAVAVNHHLEDASDNGSSFFIHNQVLFVLRVAAVAVSILCHDCTTEREECHLRIR